jgi:Ca2+:H+ antiporter
VEQSLRQSRQRPPARRATSTHYPHKGQEFSVDDAPEDIGEELEKQRKLETHARLPGGTIRSHSTLRRRTTAQLPTLSKVQSSEDREPDLVPVESVIQPAEEEPAEALEGEEPCEEEEDDDDDDDDDDDLSDAESFTLKDRQDAINVTHPFGIRIWKPALYKKDRSVQKSAEEEIHSSPGLHVSPWLSFFNFLWTILFGWWLSIICFLGSFVCLLFGVFSQDAMDYAQVLFGLSKYLFYPFGRFIKLLHEEAYAAEDEGEGRSISEYEQWQSGDLEEGRLFFGPLQINRSLVGRRRSAGSTDEQQSLLGRARRGHQEQHQDNRGLKTRFFGRGKWNIGRVIFFVFFHLIITPALLTVCGICWFMVFSIPMGKVTWLLWDHLRRHPLALVFHSEMSGTRYPGELPSSILLCTYRAVGLKYWKYTIDGTNIFLFNLLGAVAFTVFDYYVLFEILEQKNFFTHQGLIFALGLFSIIPLAYFIGQAVASISAQSSMGVGATVNAFFSTIVEVFLYCVALSQGKAALVEGSIIGSIFAGILFLPGISMCFGALKRKTQRFNVRSAGVTSTMMLFAMIGAFSPTLFYQIYGSHELKCHECTPNQSDAERDCRRCFFSQVPAVHDGFYIEAVLPYIWFSAATLFLSYVIGLLFTLRTHAAIIWSSDQDEKRGTEVHNSQIAVIQTSLHESPETLTRQPTLNSIAPARSDLPESQLYQRILGQSLRYAGLASADGSTIRTKPATMDSTTPSIKSPKVTMPKMKDSKDQDIPGLHLQSLSEADNQALSRHVAEMAATAALAATRDVTRHHHRKTSHIPTTTPANPLGKTTTEQQRPNAPARTTTTAEIDAALHPELAEAHLAAGGGHDAPNWSKTKSSVILITATLAYAIIAEILVNTVDTVLENVAIDEKFLGITLFALVPNTTEFLNAISFAMNGNIALSMEIGSAYALQVCLLQIPALVLFSAVHGRFINPTDAINYTFSKFTPIYESIAQIFVPRLTAYSSQRSFFHNGIWLLLYCASSC